jgi:predicted dinucleotide-binding enzyme
LVEGQDCSIEYRCAENQLDRLPALVADLLRRPVVAGDDERAVQVASQLVRDAGFEPVAVPLARAQEFAQGGPLYGQQLTGKVLRERFGLAK